MVILAALKEEDCLSLCMPILDELQDLLSSTPCLGIFWGRRDLNLLAHNLAFYVKSISNCNATWSFILLSHGAD